MSTLNLEQLARNFMPQLFGNAAEVSRDAATTTDGSFKPAVDVFDTPSAYILHASIAGAKKSALDVSWDAVRHAVNISGFIERPAEVDEEMMNSLAQSERQVGLFETKVNLGENVYIDADAITAKLEDGVLRIEVPKEKEGWTEIKKVDIE